MQIAEQVDRRQRIGRGQILDPGDERLVPHFDRQHQHLVQRVEDRDLDQRRHATGNGIHLLRLIQAHDLLLHAGLVVLVAILDRFHLGLERAHLGHAGELALRDREHQAADRDRQQDDRDTEVADHAEQPVEIGEDRLFEDFEPAPVDRLVELGDAFVILVMLKGLYLLGTGEEARRLSDRAAGGKQLGREGVIGLIGGVGTGAELAVELCLLIGDQRGQPIFVGETKPPAGGRELLGRLVEVLELDAIIGAAVVDGHRTGVDLPRAGVLRYADAVDIAVGRDGYGRGAAVLHRLADGEHILVVDRQLDRKALATSVGRGQRHRLARREDRRGGSPDGVGGGRLQPVVTPAEAGEIRLRRAARRKQADRRRVRCDRFLVLDQHQVVDARAA